MTGSTNRSVLSGARTRPSAEEPIRVGVVGLGPIGRAIVRVLARKPWARIVAGVDVDPDLQDLDVGEVAGLDRRLDVSVTCELDALCDAVAHATVSDLAAAAGQIEPLLRRGIAVVSTCEELARPLDPEPAARLDDAARAGGVACLGSGVNPGFVLDTLPASLTVVCQEVRRIRALRVVDAGRRREPLQRKVGAGLRPEEWTRLREEGRLRHVGLPESAHLLVAALGWDDVEICDEVIEPVIADREVSTEFVQVKKGRAAGVRQRVTGSRAGERVLELELAMYVGADSPRDAVVIDGDPPVDMIIEGGVHGDRATAAVVTNMIPRVAGAPPGLLTMVDLPVGAWL